MSLAHLGNLDLAKTRSLLGVVVAELGGVGTGQAVAAGKQGEHRVDKVGDGRLARGIFAWRQHLALGRRVVVVGEAVGHIRCPHDAARKLQVQLGFPVQLLPRGALIVWRRGECG